MTLFRSAVRWKRMPLMVSASPTSGAPYLSTCRAEVTTTGSRPRSRWKRSRFWLRIEYPSATGIEWSRMWRILVMLIDGAGQCR